MTDHTIDAIARFGRDRPFVVAQLGQSLDGRIATSTGDSRWINQAHALDHLHALRRAVDAVVIGVGTALADDPQLTVRRVPLRTGERDPARVVIDPRGRLGPGSRVYAEDGVRRILVGGESSEAPPGVELVRLHATSGIIDPVSIVRALFERGAKRLLVEGGAITVSRFVEARAVDRLHLLVAPVLLGSGRAGLELTPIASLSGALRPKTRLHPLPDGDVLFECELESAWSG